MAAPPDSIDSSYVLVCEKVLHERDNALSAIRLVDQLWVTALPPDIPIDRTATLVYFVGNVRFKPGVQDFTCDVQFQLIRPNGEVTPVGGLETVSLGPNIAGSPASIAHIVHVGVIPRAMGVHYAVLLLDGNAVAKSSFTLLPRDKDPSEQ